MSKNQKNTSGYTHQINLEFYWSKNLSRSEKLQKQVSEYIARHPTLTCIDKMEYALKKLGDRDFCIFIFGDNSWNYLQFARNGINLTFDFPCSIRLGNRYLQVDRVLLILRQYGFTANPPLRYNALGDERYMYYTDTLQDRHVALDAHFGMHHERFAAQVMFEIATVIFRYTEPQSFTVTMGSWKD